MSFFSLLFLVVLQPGFGPTNKLAVVACFLLSLLRDFRWGPLFSKHFLALFLWQASMGSVVIDTNNELEQQLRQFVAETGLKSSTKLAQKSHFGFFQIPARASNQRKNNLSTRKQLSAPTNPTRLLSASSNFARFRWAQLEKLELSEKAQ